MQYVFFAAIAVLVLTVMNKTYQKKKENMQRDRSITPEQFVIDQKSGMMALYSWAFLVLCIVVVGGLIYTKQAVPFIVFGVLFLAVPVYMLLYYYFWRIEVDGDTLRQRSAFGKTQSFDLSEITSVTSRPRKGGLNPYSYTFYSGDQKLFVLDENTDDVYLLQRLKKRGIVPKEQK